MTPFASAGVKAASLKIWKMPKSSPCIRTKGTGATVTTTEASLSWALWASVRSSRACTPPATGWTFLSWIPMQFLHRTLNSGHHFLPSPTPSEMEETTEQNNFIDLTKAFGLVSWDGLLNILLRIGCPSNLLSMIRSFHNDMNATNQYEGSMSLPRHSLASSPPPS